MHLFLVHHADAVGSEVDPQRPLSTRGLAQAASVADRARSSGVVPAAIWHSGKLRARQTAELWLRLSPFAEFKMARGLRPDDPPEIIRDALRGETRDVAVIGHWPHLPALLRLLIRSEVAEFPQHGAVLLESSDAAPWTEIWRIASKELGP